jgi:hypothetical protein
MTTITTEPLTLELVPDKPPQPERLPAVVDNSPTAFILTMTKQGATLEQIEKAMDLLERQERREAEKAFSEDFAAFRGENVIVPKTKHVDRGKGGSFDQAEYDEVCRRLSPALSRHGFGFRHDQRFGVRKIVIDGQENDEAWVWVTCYLEHRKGHSKKLELEGPPGDQSVNTPVQNMQMTASFLKRQSLLSITGTATGGEDDESLLRRSQQTGSDSDDASGDATALQAGRDASVQGMEKLTAWWGGLDNKQRGRLQRDFAQLRKVATAADSKGAAK